MCLTRNYVTWQLISVSAKKFSALFRSSDSEAHNYSADEIVTVFVFFHSGTDMRFAKFQDSAPREGLSFKFETGKWVFV